MKLFACSDIHGHYDDLLVAARRAKLINENEDFVAEGVCWVFCGDYIDRGPKSKEVCDAVQKWKQQAQNLESKIVTLEGNHERMLLDSIEDARGWLDVFLYNGGRRTIFGEEGVDALAKARSFYQRHKKFFNELDSHFVFPWAPDNKFLFVHAGVHPGSNMKNLEVANLRNSVHHLWIREEFYMHSNPKKLKENYGINKIIFGHTPVPYILEKTKQKQEEIAPIEVLGGMGLCVDTGSYYPTGCVTIVELFADGSWIVAANSRESEKKCPSSDA